MNRRNVLTTTDTTAMVNMKSKKLAEAYILGIPFGLVGAHHFYLGRMFFGFLYLCTLGLFGVGYLFDLVRMKWLVKHTNRYGSDRTMVSDCYLIGALGGLFGLHHFYMGKMWLGIFYACTVGVFGVGWLVDLVRMQSLVEAHNKNMDAKSVGTAYIMACSPFGIFGAYHYYLGNYRIGILHTLTLGIFGFGWIVDLFRMKVLVKVSNGTTRDHGKTKKITAYILCMSPLGIFGAHHFFLKRYFNGWFYAATFGMFGIGWIFDMLRIPVLFERYAAEDEHKYLDDAYMYWFPFGLFGLHHFYLGKTRWGILYLCSLGCLSFGWIIDGFRLPRLLRKFNESIDMIDDTPMHPLRFCRPTCRKEMCPNENHDIQTTEVSASVATNHGQNGTIATIEGSPYHSNPAYDDSAIVEMA